APALRRVGEVGDGWFGVNVTVEDAKAKIARIQQYAQAAGRDPGKLHFSVSPGLGESIEMDRIKQYRDVGVHQVVVGAIPRNGQGLKGEIERLAGKLVAPSAKL